MRRILLESALILAVLGTVALGGYELTAKSPRLLGQPLPGWYRTLRVEHLVPWRQPTRIYPLDKVLHEGREAALYYGMMAGIIKPVRAPRSRIASGIIRTTAAAPAASVPGHAPEPGRPHNARRG